MSTMKQFKTDKIFNISNLTDFYVLLFLLKTFCSYFTTNILSICQTCLRAATRFTYLSCQQLTFGKCLFLLFFSSASYFFFCINIYSKYLFSYNAFVVAVADFMLGNFHFHYQTHIYSQSRSHCHSHSHHLHQHQHHYHYNLNESRSSMSAL